MILSQFCPKDKLENRIAYFFHYLSFLQEDN